MSKTSHLSPEENERLQKAIAKEKIFCDSITWPDASTIMDDFEIFLKIFLNNMNNFDQFIKDLEKNGDLEKLQELLNEQNIANGFNHFYDKIKVIFSTPKAKPEYVRILLDSGFFDDEIIRDYDSLNNVKKFYRKNKDYQKGPALYVRVAEAIEDNNIEEAKKLIDKAGGIDFLKEKGKGLLHFSYEKRNFAALDLLLSYGVEIDDFENKKITILQLAVQRGDEKMVDYILTKNPDLEKLSKTIYIGISDPRGYPQTALHYAAMKAEYNPSITRKLIEHGAKIDCTNNRGGSALHCAIYYCNVDAIKHLLSLGANPLLADEEGHTAISLLTHQNGASYEAIQEIIQSLINVGVDITSIFDIKYLLTQAVTNDNLNFIRYILSREDLMKSIPEEEIFPYFSNILGKISYKSQSGNHASEFLVKVLELVDIKNAIKIFNKTASFSSKKFFKFDKSEQQKFTEILSLMLIEASANNDEEGRKLIDFVKKESKAEGFLDFLSPTYLLALGSKEAFDEKKPIHIFINKLLDSIDSRVAECEVVKDKSRHLRVLAPLSAESALKLHKQLKPDLLKKVIDDAYAKAYRGVSDKEIRFLFSSMIPFLSDEQKYNLCEVISDLTSNNLDQKAQIYQQITQERLLDSISRSGIQALIDNGYSDHLIETLFSLEERVQDEICEEYLKEFSQEKDLLLLEKAIKNKDVKTLQVFFDCAKDEQKKLLYKRIFGSFDYGDKEQRDLKIKEAIENFCANTNVQNDGYLSKKEEYLLQLAKRNMALHILQKDGTAFAELYLCAQGLGEKYQQALMDGELIPLEIAVKILQEQGIVQDFRYLDKDKYPQESFFVEALNGACQEVLEENRLTAFAALAKEYELAQIKCRAIEDKSKTSPSAEPSGASATQASWRNLWNIASK